MSCCLFVKRSFDTVINKNVSFCFHYLVDEQIHLQYNFFIEKLFVDNLVALKMLVSSKLLLICSAKIVQIGH